MQMFMKCTFKFFLALSAVIPEPRKSNFLFLFNTRILSLRSSINMSFDRVDAFALIIGIQEFLMFRFSVNVKPIVSVLWLRDLTPADRWTERHA